MKVVFVYADTPGELNTSVWRCKWPAEALARAGHSAALFFYGDWLKRRPIHIAWGAEADVIVYERIAMDHTLQDMRWWKRHGKKIVFSFDDAYDIMPDTIRTKEVWHKDGKSFGDKLITYFYDAMEIADAIETPSKLLSARYKANKALYIPNYPDLNNPNWGKPYPVRIPKRVGWAGGASHILSFTESGIIPVIQDMPITILGGHPKIIEKLNNCFHIKAVRHEYYPYILGQLGVGLAPLAGEFDQHRSWIKCLEYSLKGIPWVVTDAPPYEDCSHGGIKIENKTRRWKGAINYLLNNDISELIEEGLEWAWSQGIDDHIEERVKEYAAL